MVTNEKKLLRVLLLVEFDQACPAMPNVGKIYQRCMRLSMRLEPKGLKIGKARLFGKITQISKINNFRENTQVRSKTAQITIFGLLKEIESLFLSENGLK